ncbi:MAG: ATP-binding protein [Calditrichia bacterium]
MKKLKISQKLWLLTIGIIGVLSLAYYLLVIPQINRHFEKSLQIKATGLSHTAASGLGIALFSQRNNAIRPILEGLTEDPDVAFVFLRDAGDSVISGYHFQNNLTLINSFLDSGETLQYFANYLLVKQTLFYNDVLQGELVIGFHLNRIRGEIAAQQWNLLVWGSFLVLISVILTYFLSRAISRPLENAASHIQNYSPEETAMKLRLPEKGNDEIAHLARALNQLSDNLDQNLRELGQSKKYLETLFQLSPIPILIADVNGNINEANESASSFFGMERSVLVNLKLENFFQPDDLKAIFERIVKQKMNVKGFVTTIRLGEENSKVAELNIASHHTDENDLKNIIFAIIDITEKIDIQREILHNQTKLQRINDELSGKTTELERLSSINKKNAHRLSQLIRISQDMMRSGTANVILKKLLEEGARLLEADESLIYLWEKDHQHLISSISYPAEIQQRVQHNISENHNIIWKTYRENEPFVLQHNQLNSLNLEVLGLPEDPDLSVMAVPVSEKEYRFGVIVFIKRSLPSLRVEDVHLLRTLANQAAILLDNFYLVHALKEKAGSLEKALSDLQLSQQQVVQLQKMESLGTLVGGIAHDFNNILGIILPNTDLLREDSGVNERMIRRIDIIAESAQRAADLTRQLLMFSRNQDIQEKTISINSLISGLTVMLKRTLGKEYEIILDLDEHLPSVQADETRLNQVLINLAVNARDAMPEGGKITIKTALKEYAPHTGDGTVKKYVCISMTDTGCGIKQKNLPKIFDPFFTTKGVGQGSGLGLSVVYGIMQSHNGHVEVSSQEGRGTTFYLYLPGGGQQELKPSEKASRTLLTGTEKILVIDDEEMIRDSISEILMSLGYRAETASSGSAGLKIVEHAREKFQLAIVDMVMPGMNGIETIRRLKELDPDLRMLLSTGKVERNQMIPEDVQLDGVLPKPYRLRELALKVRQILAHKSGKAAPKNIFR